MPNQLTEANAIAAIDAVTGKYPTARFVTEGDFGRVVTQDRLVSLAFNVADEDAELCAWIDASQRLGSGNQKW